jgi:hypothetical protein
MGRELCDDSGDLEAAISAVAEAEHRAMAAAAAGPGVAVSEIEAVLIRELRDRGGFMPPEEIHAIALQICDPAWPIKHPLQWKRLTQGTPEAADGEAAVAAEIDRTVARLNDAVDSLRGMRRFEVSARRTVDGVDYEIRIDRWSARRARKLQRIAAPTAVTVRPYSNSG